MKEWGDRHWWNVAFMVVLLSITFYVVMGFWPPAEREEPTREAAPRADALLLLREEVAGLHQLVEGIPACDARIAHEAAEHILEYLNRRVRPHLKAWESRVSASCALPHAVLERMIAGFEAAAASPGFDAAELCRRIHALIGALEMHLEVEHETVLPPDDREEAPKEMEQGEERLAG